jgi:multimeric flavodoxin WrbA
MRTLIIYKSYHKKNTEKIAKVTTEAMNADIAKVEDVHRHGKCSSVCERSFESVIQKQS